MPIAIADLTEAKVDGTGAFDVIMQAVSKHLDQEYAKGRFAGDSYAQVYLGALSAAMDRGLAFALSKDKTNAEIDLLNEQITNAQKEGLVLDGQKCKLDAEFDVLSETKLKVIAETALLSQKKVTEEAQTSSVAVVADSVIGKQKALYQAQTDGYARDAEQKATKIMVDSWNVRRTTDDATIADSTNKLGDTHIGQAVQKLLDGINA